jgi:hypothetical protein
MPNGTCANFAYRASQRYCGVLMPPFAASIHRRRGYLCVKWRGAVKVKKLSGDFIGSAIKRSFWIIIRMIKNKSRKR